MDSDLFNIYQSCCLCPRECGVNRLAGEKGLCGCDSRLYAARASLHMWEEPCISGETGSGTVFFSGCNLGCVYCQNSQISGMKVAKEISIERLCEIFFELAEKGANNINLVTAGHYIPHVAIAVESAKYRGLDIPIVYNCGGYETVEALKLLEGLIDVYLPDFKYMSPALAGKYSKACDYPEIAKAAVSEMYRQTGPVRFDENGMMTKGVMVRHLVLPGCEKDSEDVIRYLYETYGDNIYLSIMSQYTPMASFVKEGKYPELFKKVNRQLYNKLIDFAVELGVENAFIQEEDVAEESFIPMFDYEGL